MNQPLTRRNIVGYGVGDLANGLSFGMSSTFLLAFYTDVLGITALAAGTLFLVARMIDAVTDPLMGVFADKWFRWRALRHQGRRFDKFRPFLLYGSVPVVIASVVLFMAPAGLSDDQKLVWAYATYIIWGMAYTFINIPYGSLAAVMTQEPIGRAKLSAARGVGGAIGAVIDRVAVPLVLVQFAGDEASGYFYAMAMLGGIALVGYWVSYATVSENVVVRQNLETSPPIWQTVRSLAGNRPFIALSLATLAMMSGFAIGGSTTIYYFRENLDALGLMPLSGLSIIGPVFLIAPLIPKLVARFGLKASVSGGAAIGSVLYLALLVLPSNVYLFLIGSFLSALAMVVPMMLLWGMVSDAIDYNQFKTGFRQEGAIYGAYSFVRKTAQAIAGFGAGAGLALAGYDASLQIQAPVTLDGIKFLVVGVPAIGLLIAAAIFHWMWPLTAEKQAEITRAISAAEA
jgi:GPH family glycoside/pentoside/hexuronide:cation symporter